MSKLKIRPIHSEESGIILLTVVVLIIVLSIVVISVMSLNISQSKTSVQVAHDVVADELATGIFFRNHQARFEGTTATFSGEVIDNYIYSPSVITGGGGPNNTNTINVNVSY